MSELSEDSTIQTEIESDASYRTRLKAVGTNWFDYLAIDATDGDKLDEIGMKHRVYRAHTHTCTPALRGK